MSITLNLPNHQVRSMQVRPELNEDLRVEVKAISIQQISSKFSIAFEDADKTTKQYTVKKAWNIKNRWIVKRRSDIHPINVAIDDEKPKIVYPQEPRKPVQATTEDAALGMGYVIGGSIFVAAVGWVMIIDSARNGDSVFEGIKKTSDKVTAAAIFIFANLVTAISIYAKFVTSPAEVDEYSQKVKEYQERKQAADIEQYNRLITMVVLASKDENKKRQIVKMNAETPNYLIPK
jgi:hypothetical protein